MSDSNMIRTYDESIHKKVDEVTADNENHSHNSGINGYDDTSKIILDWFCVQQQQQQQNVTIHKKERRNIVIFYFTIIVMPAWL